MKVRLTDDLLDRMAKKIYSVTQSAVADALGMMVYVRPWDGLSPREQNLHRDYGRAAFKAIFKNEDEPT
jgi:hypothetical protein